jgi:hypothetical protein
MPKNYIGCSHVRDCYEHQNRIIYVSCELTLIFFDTGYKQQYLKLNIVSANIKQLI